MPVLEDYSPDKKRPLRGYSAVLGIYGFAVTACGVIAGKQSRPLPAVTLGDFLLTSLATHKLSRILTKDAVTSPLRAPFTKYVKPTGAGEVKEAVRAEGGMQSVGELSSCPFCLSVWVSTGFTVGSIFAPKATRVVAATVSVIAVSDFLQFAYDKLKDS